MTKATQHDRADLTSAVLGLVGARGPLSRAAIARQLAISATTVTNVTRPLLERGDLVETGTVPSTGGRPAVLLDLARPRRSALGVKVTPNHLTFAEVDVTGATQPGTSVDLDMRAPDALDVIAATIAEHTAGRAEAMLGVGLAIPGFAHPDDPEVVTAPTLGWRSVALGRIIRERVGLPVHIDNDVNSLAVAARLYGAQPAARDAALITIGYGIGCALIVDGSVLHGSHGGAGELGHIVADPDGEPCACGLRGCLETVIGDNALARRAREAGIVGQGEGKSELNAAATAGHAGAQALFADAAATLGRTLASLVQVFDPDALIISGEGVDVWRFWEPTFTRTLRTHLPAHRRDLLVETREFADDTWAHGAASLVFAQPLAHTHLAAAGTRG